MRARAIVSSIPVLEVMLRVVIVPVMQIGTMFMVVHHRGMGVFVTVAAGRRKSVVRVVMVSVVVGVTVRVCHRDMSVRVPMVRTEHEEESPRHQ